MNEFTYEEKAKREHIWGRIFLMGPTGSGKSRGALELASRLGNPVTLINTERGRGKLYSDRFDYALIDLSGDDGNDVDHSPERLVAAIDFAEAKRPGGTIVFDSGSHEWIGKNGVLSQADRFGDWKTVRPKHNAWVERLMAVQGHLVVCVRAKMKYDVGEEEVNGRKRQTVTMMGVGPVQSDDLQYEFNLVGRFDQNTKEVTWSGHVDPMQGTANDLVEDADAVAETLSKWLSEGDPPVAPPAATDEDVAKLVASLTEEGHAQETIDETFAKIRGKSRGVLPPEWVARNLEQSVERLAKIKAAEKAKAEAASKATEPAPDPAPAGAA